MPLLADLTEPEFKVLKEIAAVYRATFCDACRALPELPLERCPACREALADVLELEKLYRTGKGGGQG